MTDGAAIAEDLVDVLELSLYDPDTGAGPRFGLPGELMSRRVHAFSAAALLDQFRSGALLLDVPEASAGVPGRLSSRMRATPGGVIRAGEIEPAHPATVRGWRRLRRRGRPVSVDRALVRAVAGDPAQRLVAAGVVEDVRRAPRALTPAGLEAARAWRAGLDAVARGEAEAETLDPAMHRLGALLVGGEIEELAFRGASDPTPADVRARLAPLLTEEEAGPDGHAWRITIGALRRINAPTAH